MLYLTGKIYKHYHNIWWSDWCRTIQYCSCEQLTHCTKTSEELSYHTRNSENVSEPLWSCYYKRDQRIAERVASYI